MIAHHETATAAMSGWYLLGGAGGIAVVWRMMVARIKRK